jgi:hypothetical protein
LIGGLVAEGGKNDGGSVGRVHGVLLAERGLAVLGPESDTEERR